MATVNKTNTKQKNNRATKEEHMGALDILVMWWCLFLNPKGGCTDFPLLFLFNPWNSSHVWMWELTCKESWALKNWCFWTVVLEKTLKSPWDCKEIQPVHPKGDQSVLGVHGKDWCWSWNPNTLATWCEELTHLKRPWCWARLRAGGEGDDRGWDGWIASPTQWRWVWVNSGRPGVLPSMGLQEVGHDWATELN